VSENYITTDLELCNKNCVFEDLEIITENRVTVVVWKQQQKLVHGWRMKSIGKTESSLTHGIVSENIITAKPEIINEI